MIGQAAQVETGTVVDKATGAVLGSVPLANADDVRLAIGRAHVAKGPMGQLPAHRRATLLAAIADGVQARREELAGLLARENGKPIRQTRDEVDTAIATFRGFGEEAKRLEGRVLAADAVPGLERDIALTLVRPVGVVAAIVPFNYPVELYAHKVGGALAAGNAVIGKAPSDCPLTVRELGAIIDSAGFPADAHQLLTGAGTVVGPVLASDPRIDAITITGSVEAGRAIARLASETLKRVHVELGGNDAAIVCADADLDLAGRMVVTGRLARGNGQICCSNKRVFVDRRVLTDFMAIVEREASALVVGSPLDERTDVGPLISEAAAVDVEARVRDAERLGARVILGGLRRGPFVEPTVLLDCPTDASLFRDETFGPVLPIVAFDSLEEAIALANDSIYGLQAGIFTQDLHTALDLADRVEAGGIIVNGTPAFRTENIPFGGVKQSGHTRESLYETIRALSDQKTVVIRRVLSRPPS